MRNIKRAKKIEKVQKDYLDLIFWGDWEEKRQRRSLPLVYELAPEKNRVRAATWGTGERTRLKEVRREKRRS